MANLKANYVRCLAKGKAWGRRDLSDPPSWVPDPNFKRPVVRRMVTGMSLENYDTYVPIPKATCRTCKVDTYSGRCPECKESV